MGSEDIPAVFKALGIDLDLFRIVTMKLTKSQMLQTELNVTRAMMYRTRGNSPNLIDHKAVSEPSKEIKAAKMLSKTVNQAFFELREQMSG